MCAKPTGTLKGKPFIDHKAVKVGHVFRGLSDGSQLAQTDADARMSVTFVSPALPAAVQVALEGVMPNMCVGAALGLRRYPNKAPLPRLVRWSDDSSAAKAGRKNAIMAEGRQGKGGKPLFPVSKAVLKRAQIAQSLQPLFCCDGSDYRTPIHQVLGF